MSLDTPAQPFDESGRQHALDSYRILDSLPEDAYDDIVKLASTLCDTPIALVSLIDRDRQWFKAQVGVDVSQSGRDVAVCDHAIRDPDHLMEIRDLDADARFAGNPLLADLAARFYAGVPLVTPEGAPIGTVCVLDRLPRTLTDTQRGALESLARLTMTLLGGRQRERALERAAVLQPAGVAIASTPGSRAEATMLVEPYIVAVVELQDFSGVAGRIGERALEKALQQLDHHVEASVRAERGDVVNRATGSGEFIAVLRGDDAGDTLRRLRDVVARRAGEAGLMVLVGAAQTDPSAVGESMEHVFLRADQALSAEKTRSARSGPAD